MRERLVAARKERVGRREIAALEAIEFARARAGGGDDGDDGHQARRAPPRRGPGHAHRRAARIGENACARPCLCPPRRARSPAECALVLAVDEPAHRAPVQHMLGANELTYNAEHIIRIEKVRAAAPSPPPLSRRAAARRAPLLLSRLPPTSELASEWLTRSRRPLARFAPASRDAARAKQAAAAAEKSARTAVKRVEAAVSRAPMY